MRFEPPVDYDPAQLSHSVVQETKHFRSACMQIGDAANITYGSEDCLFANVWQPANAKKGDNLPVLCFIYGGSWQFGETEPYNGSALAAKHNVVYASIAYRTGPIGLMPFHEDQESKSSTGNWGMLDMQSGLRWLKREIGNFGGDPKRMTIHGQSSGGQAVELHYVMPQSKGLLTGIISESGGLSAQALETGLAATMKVAKATGCVVTVKGTKQASKACLQKVPAVELTSMTSSLGLSPHVDGVTIPSDPLQMLADGHINPGVALVMGAQTNDSNKELFGPFIKKDNTLRPLPSDAYLTALEMLVPKNQTDIKLKDILALYPAHNDHPLDPVLGGSVSNLRNLGSTMTDGMLCGARRRLSLINKWYPGKAFMYRFNYWYQSNKNCSADPNYHSPAFGAEHEDEVTFVMGQPIFMQGGSCCGIFGDHNPAGLANISACPLDAQCANCYAPEKFDPDGKGGYTPYFDKKEAAFADAVGQFWTNFASSQNPNVRAKAGAGPAPVSQSQPASSIVMWPNNPTGKALRQNVVLDAAGITAEGTIHGNPAVCALWDRVSVAHTSAQKQARAAHEYSKYEAGSAERLAAAAPADPQSRSLLIAKMQALAQASTPI
jgi:carboxylesterase type B